MFFAVVVEDLLCVPEGLIHSYRLLAVNRRVRNWNHSEHDCATRHGLENVRGENGKISDFTGLSGLAGES